MVSDHPDRFGAFAILPLPDVAAAIREAEYALDTLKLEGVCLLTHVDGRHLGQPEEDELYAELDRRKAVVFIHPLRNQAKNMPAYNYPSGMTELVLDTTRAIHNLLWNGTFGKYPNIRWIMPHGGGTVPFLLYRMSAMNNHPRVAEKLAGGTVADTLRRLYYDVAEICAPAPLKCLMEITEPFTHPVWQRLSIFAASHPGEGCGVDDHRFRSLRRLGCLDAAGHRKRQRFEIISEAGEAVRDRTIAAIRRDGWRTS